MTAKDAYVAVQAGAPAAAAATALGDGTDLAKLWSTSRAKDKAGESRVFYGVNGDSIVSAISVGAAPKDAPTTEGAENKLKEVSRKNAAKGALALKGAGSKAFAIDPLHSAHAAAVGSILANFQWNLKTTSADKEKLEPVEISMLGSEAEPTLPSEKAQGNRVALDWKTGVVYGQAQNLARELMEVPANRLTPTLFAERAAKEFEGLKNVTYEVHDLEWAKERKMGSFISVGAGSVEPIKFLELHYKNGKEGEAPIAFVGKGVCFDSGGISLKPGASMKEMRADMGGAACTLSAVWGAAKLGLPVNVSLFIPLVENMPSGHATKPGDIVVAGNGVTIEVDNTDAEGRLILADALYYATSVYKPKTVIDVATLTGAMMIALGDVYTGIFSNSDDLWDELDTAAKSEHDLVWRMPLSESYMGQINKTGMDLCNTGGRPGGSCTAAIFLKRFVDGLIVDGSDSDADPSSLIRWGHLDIAGVMTTKADGGYNVSGMSGRSTRVLLEFLRRSA